MVSTNGAGYDTVDLAACTRAGVLAVNQAGGNKEAVAEHALALMLCLAKRIVEAERSGAPDIPVGTLSARRDFTDVRDVVRAYRMLVTSGRPGEVYNVGGGNDVMNVDLTERILQLLGKPRSLITPVADRQGHDRRYSLDTTKLRGLGWEPRVDFAQGLAETVAWYRDNPWWWRAIKEQDPQYRAYYQAQYHARS